MAIFASLFGVLGRFLGKILNMALGWATTLLFGRVPQSKQILVLGISLGSLVWVVALLGILFPNVGTFLLAAIPRPTSFIRDEWIRLAMLIAAIVVPILIGIAGYFLLDPDDRPGGTGLVKQLLRGYPYAFVLALTLIFMAIIAPLRRARSVFKRWTDAHIPVVVKPGGYERVAKDLEDALDKAELGIDRRRAPRVLEVPSKLLASVAGPGVKKLVPDELVMLAKPSLEVLVYPSDIAISGTKGDLARARAAITSRLAFTAAYLTSSRESQEIEDRLERIWSATHGNQGDGKGNLPTPDSPHDMEKQAMRGELPAADDPSAGEGGGKGSTNGAAGQDAGSTADHTGRAATGPELDGLAEDLRGVDHDLARIEIDYEQWEVLYRLRLQVERDLLEQRSRVRAEKGLTGLAQTAEEAIDQGVGASLDLGLTVAEGLLEGSALGRVVQIAHRIVR